LVTAPCFNWIIVVVTIKKVIIMGKINQGILGGFSGSVGPVIGGSWKGIEYIRAKPMSYKYDPSEEQIAHTNQFTANIAFAKLVKSSLIKPIWNIMAVKMSGFNLFVKVNKDVFDETGQLADFENLILSVGNLPLPENISVKKDQDYDNAVLITWDNNPSICDVAPTDLLRIVVFNGKEPVIINGLPFTRASNQANLQLPFTAAGDVHVYLFFQDKEGTSYSESVHSSVSFS
jgi:hypothetical protein